MKKLISALLAAAMLLSLAACGEAAAAPTGSADTYVFTDDLGREVTAPAHPQRVAAMIGSFADVWCLAGGKDTLVAAADDSWTSFDLGLGEDVVNLGAIKEPSLEALIAAEPDLILASCNTAANLELQDTFEAAGMCVAYFDVQTLDDYLNMLGICTALTGCEENYAEYGEVVRAQADAAIARQTGEAPTVLCIRATGVSCKVKGSRDFVLGEMLADLGCVNIADSDESLLEDLSLEAIIAAEPDYIFVVLQGSDPTDAMETLEQTLLQNPAWSELQAVREGRFYTLEHELYNLKPNARWGEAYEKLADILYPDAGKDRAALCGARGDLPCRLRHEPCARAGEGAARGRGARALLRRGRHGGGADSAVFSAAAHLRLPYRGRGARRLRRGDPGRALQPAGRAQRNRRKRRGRAGRGALLRARALGLCAGAARGLCRRTAERAAGAANCRAHRRGEDNPRPRGRRRLRHTLRGHRRHRHLLARRAERLLRLPHRQPR